ncbi:hypothetical protein V2O64_21255 [Verrucomicrobiaceae bacterium 227]
MGDVWVSLYELEAADSLNARSVRRFFEGALVRIGPGFGCLHPWPELGDPSLEECLADLMGPRKFGIVKRTLACIEADGGAREEGHSLFEGLVLPVSHATLPVLSEEAVEGAMARGYGVIKTKAGKNACGELELIRNLIGKWPELRWRIDFNETGNLAQLVGVFEKWTVAELQRIDFLEDPVRFQSGEWEVLAEATGLSMANDRHQEEDDHRSEVLVMKPAVEVLRPGDQRVVVTSAMDHPLGQCFAAREAARFGCREVCGLQTHGLFRESVFSEVLGEVGPDFQVPDGAGLGFGDLLEGLEWSRGRG